MPQVIGTDTIWRSHYISPLWWSLYLQQPYERRVVYVTTPAVTEDAQKVVSQLIKAKFELNQTQQGINDLRQRKQDAEAAIILEKLQRMATKVEKAREKVETSKQVIEALQ